MKRKSFVRMNCSIAQSLEVVGEWWTLLIIREAMLFGARRFGQFQEAIGIAENILAERLRKLVKRGVFERIPPSKEARRGDYHLTEMGRALVPVVIALMQWGDRWIAGTRRTPVRIFVKGSGVELARIRVESKRGIELTPDDLVLVAGPGATAATKARFKPKILANERGVFER